MPSKPLYVGIKFILAGGVVFHRPFATGWSESFAHPLQLATCSPCLPSCAIQNSRMICLTGSPTCLKFVAMFRKICPAFFALKIVFNYSLFMDSEPKETVRKECWLKAGVKSTPAIQHSPVVRGNSDLKHSVRNLRIASKGESKS